MHNNIKGPKQQASQISSKELKELEEPMQNKGDQLILIRQNSLLRSIPNPIDIYSFISLTELKTQLVFQRPQVKKKEIFADLCTLTLYIYTLYEFIYQYDNLPNIVDVDFGFDSSLDQIKKEYLGFILIGDTILLIILSILQCFTHKFKYLIEIKQSNSEMVFLITRYFISSYKLSIMAMFMYATISIFKIISKEWQPYTLYLSGLFVLPFTVFGFMYYLKMNKIANNPFL